MLLVEDLRRQWVAFLWQLVSGDVAVHPQPLFLQHGDVYFLEADSIGLQETHHFLLMLFYLRTDEEGREMLGNDGDTVLNIYLVIDLIMLYVCMIWRWRLAYS